MDVAAQEINKLVQRILPDRPYHLSVSATGRYPVPPGLWPNTSPLQYTTFVSEADRGILLTRPYFDIQLETEDDPNNTKNKRGKATSSTNIALPGGSPAGAGNKSETKKPVTKMSFKDYQQSKNQKKLPGSPTNTPATTTKPDTNLRKSEGAMASYVDRQHLPPKPEYNGDSEPTAQTLEVGYLHDL
ncbi:hypothetical protein SPBR_03848 [Sporothrix brasiliensis 5110]|uniref:Uncharacterized protein n=1 Tax=Sporothrix brasiliensis 5110 TaxID=1398154 RepID=A0A0C2J7K4_9PEZI|nr:uncharacterized protein SPBR_03848 [Sporothrix brasiliensis 5110]KIH94980.1 hypothetical protein SPBR_03848 [Sporothrix brasiliensis 5110]